MTNAIMAFQQNVLKLAKPDGRVDPRGKTWRALIRAAGEIDTNPTGWPPRPSFPALTPARRDAIFTTFGSNYESANSEDPDEIRIKGTWVRDNIEYVEIPQLAIIKNPHTGKKMRKGFHKKSVHQLIGVWQSWENAGLLDRVLTFDGAFVPRYMRETGQTKLSNHSWGTAFDINWEWNRLKRTPAIIWERGCVFELVDLAHRWGFYWGGHFQGDRVDGMHFEIARIV